MEITILQVVGMILIAFGGYGFYKGFISWSIEVRPGSSPRDRGFHIDLTPEPLKWRKEGKFEGKWVRPVCSIILILGIVLLFIPSETITFKI
ncbi:hypothetical protein [Shewanella sp.]|uniref:hypothetical protein n=1 Tax=Shewanella sp. TaxID=50422 RepID=UPI0035673B52